MLNEEGRMPNAEYGLSGIKARLEFIPGSAFRIPHSG